MAEELNLRFRVINAGVAVEEIPTVIDAEPAIIKRRRLHVDAEPLDGTVRTLELELPAKWADQIAVGDVLNCSISIEPAAVEPAPAESEA